MCRPAHTKVSKFVTIVQRRPEQVHIDADSRKMHAICSIAYLESNIHAVFTIHEIGVASLRKNNRGRSQVAFGEVSPITPAPWAEAYFRLLKSARNCSRTQIEKFTKTTPVYCRHNTHRSSRCHLGNQAPKIGFENVAICDLYLDTYDFTYDDANLPCMCMWK